MSSLSKIKNIKHLLVVLLLLPTISNCKPTEITVIPARLPNATCGLITVAGITTAIGISAMSKSNNSNSIALGVSIASLAGGFVAYKYLNHFTPIGTLNKAKEILQENEKQMEMVNHILTSHNSSEHYGSEDFIRMFTEKKVAKDYPEITFFKKDLPQLLSKTEHAQKLIQSTKNSFTMEYSEKKSFIQGIENIIIFWLKDMKNQNSLREWLETEENNVQETLGKLTQISSNISLAPSFGGRLKECNDTKLFKVKYRFLQEKLKKVENKNSYLNNIFKVLCANVAFMNGFIRIISYFINLTAGENTSEA